MNVYFDDHNTDVEAQINKACQSLAKELTNRYDAHETVSLNNLLDEYIELSKMLFETAIAFYDKLDSRSDGLLFMCSAIDYMTNVDSYGCKDIQVWFKSGLCTLSELYYSTCYLSSSQKDFLKILKEQIEQNITD